MSLKWSAANCHYEECNDAIISADLSPRASVLAKNFSIKFAGEEEQPNER